MPIVDYPYIGTEMVRPMLSYRATRLGQTIQNLSGSVKIVVNTTMNVGPYLI
jgi:hypothetical protein